MRVPLPSLFLAVLLVAGSASSAAASDGWCDTDPLIVVKTPSGALVPLYVQIGAQGVEHIVAASVSQANYTIAAQGDPNGTLVTVTVVVPSDVFASTFQTRSAVSTGPYATGTVFATTIGQSNDAMRMRFMLPVH